MSSKYVYNYVDYNDAINFLLPRHYSGRTPSISYSFGVFEKETSRLVAVCTFGLPASPSLCVGLAGEENKNNVLELNRLCREDDYTEPLSKFVAWCLKQLKNKNVFIVSYSDMAMNHHGYIYQACNFLYTGATTERTDIYCGNGKHSRHYSEEDKDNGLRLKRFSKHRYIYICAKTKHKKQEMLTQLKYPIIKGYPKGDNDKDYVLGTYIANTIIDTKNNKVIKEKNMTSYSEKDNYQQTYLFF